MKKILSLIIVFSIIFLNVVINSKNVEALELDTTDNLPTCYQQGDYRWANEYYGTGTIWGTGCGIVSLTNAVNFVTGNFFDPSEIATYAYAINAYNTPEGGGTWREVLYRKLQTYEAKYGFTVTNPSIWDDAKNTTLKKSLANGSVAVGHVSGHFIALCGYDEATNSFLVYDCASSPSTRHSYAWGTWLTEEELCTLPKMTLDWFCLISSNINRKTQLDGATNKSNGKAEVSYYVSNPGIDSPFVSGYALDTRGINYYYYIMDYDDQEHMLSSTTRTDVDMTGYEMVDANKVGFKGVIDTTGLSCGTHYANIFAKCEDGGVLNIAEVEVYVGQNEQYDETNKTFTIDMSNCIGQVDIHDSWSTGGITEPCFIANYNILINIGNLDLSQFSKAEIIYSTSSSFDADKDGTQSIIGFKKCRNTFGYHGSTLNLNNAIAYANMTDGTSGGWTAYRTATIDLSNIDYKGRVYMNGYNQEGEYYAVTKVIFYYNESETVAPTTYETLTSNKEINLSSENSNSHNLGSYDLSTINYVEVEFNDSAEKTVTLTNSNNAVFDAQTTSSNKVVLEVNCKTCSDLIINTTAKINKVTLYDTSSDKYLINNGTNHKVLQYHDTNGTAVYKEVEHVCKTTTIDPTCTEKGQYTAICVLCGEVVENKELAANGHTITTIYVDETHHKNVCDVCDEEFETVEHNYDTYVYDGSFHYQTCSCGAQLNAEKHLFDDNCKCTVCGYECEHTSTKNVLGTDATCTSTGLTNGKVCKSCGKHIVEQEVIPMLEHQYENGVCVNCGAADPNYSQPTPSPDPEPTPSSGCNAGINIIYLLSGISVIGIFFKRK